MSAPEVSGAVLMGDPRRKALRPRSVVAGRSAIRQRSGPSRAHRRQRVGCPWWFSAEHARSPPKPPPHANQSHYSSDVVAHADKPIFHAVSADEWEQWIVGDTTGAGVRLRLRKKSSKMPGITYVDALDVALCHGWIDGQRQSDDADYFLQAFTPRRSRSPWSQTNRDNVERLIAAGRMLANGHAEIERAKQDGRWDAAYRQRGAPVPEDLSAALSASPAAAATFAGLSSQNRWAIVFRLGNVKRPATRERKLNEFISMLEQGTSIHP